MNAFLQQSWTRLIVIPLVFTGLVANGNPLGEAVRVGEVQFERTDGALRILQGSDKAIIDWESFSISAGELTEFIQPGERSAALNRVRGLTASQIDGALRANGNVLLINPNGIVIGPSGTVDVGGFIASTLDVSDAEFLAGGDMSFRGPSQQGIVNLGRISATGGDVFLIAATVENSGAISAPNGTVGLAAGNDVLLKESGTPGERIFVRGASGGKKATGVVNKGTIDANIAELKAHGGNVYALAVNNEGRVAATGVSREGGQIFLRAGGGGTKVGNSGTLKATRQNGDGGRIEIDAGPGGEVENTGTVDVSSDSGKGGEIFIIGSQIALKPGSLVIADGATGGGEIFIGGGQRGQDGDLMNAENVTVSEGASISANATGNGDGGQVIVFAENRLDFSGEVSAMGGSLGGNGGFIELSGKNEVLIPDLSSRVNLSAVDGIAGTLLFDPEDILIINGSITSPIPGSPVNSNTLVDADINAFLAGASLVIETTATGTGPGNITLDDNVEILWTTGSSLTFDATNDFILNGGTTGARIDSQGTGALFVNAGNAIDISGEIESGFGDISLDATGPINVGGSIATSGNILIDSEQSVVINDGSITGSGAGGEKIEISGLEGIQLINGAQVNATGNTTIALNGNAGMTPVAGEFEGVFLDGSSITSTDGNIDITGVGGGGGINSPAKGIHLRANSLIESTGAGSITLKGAAVDGSSGPSEGVALFDSTVRSNTGNVMLEGTGGGDMLTAFSSGVLLSNSVAESTGSGNISINGHGGNGSNAHGVELNLSSLQTTGGNIDIFAQSGAEAGSVGLATSGMSSIGSSTMTGNITVQADSIDLLTGANIQSSGNLVIKPVDPVSDINIGLGASDSGLQLSANEIGAFTDGFSSITIGDSVAGNGVINISEVTFLDPIIFEAPGSTGEIVVNGQITGSDNASVTINGSGATTYLSANIITAGNEIVISDSLVLRGNAILDTTNGGPSSNGADVKIEGTVTGDDGPHNFAINTGTTGLIDLQGAVGGTGNIGNIDFTSSKLDLDVSLNSVGTVNITTSAGFKNSSTATIDSVGQISINANQGSMPSSGDFNGVEIMGGITSSNGSISINGVGGDSTGNEGVRIQNGASVSGNGNVAITGAAQNSGESGVVVDAPVSSTNGGVTITTNSGNIKIDGMVTAPDGVSLVGSETENTDFLITSGLQIMGLSVDGGAGSSINTLDFSNFGDQITLSADQLDNIRTLKGGTNTADTFAGGLSEVADYLFDGMDQFSYTGRTSNEIIDVTSFENVNGNGMLYFEDPPPGNFFDFQPGGSLSGNLNGGVGNTPNTLSYADYDLPVQINLESGTASAIGGTIMNISNFIGSADTNDKFVISNSPNVVQIIGLNQFESQGGVTANGFGDLTGGTSADIFEFLPGGSITGNLSGGGGPFIDTISYEYFDSAVEVDLENQTATGIGGNFDGITDFIGSSELDDEIKLTDGNDVIEIFDNDSGTVNNQETFSSFEKINAGAGSDVFNFNGLFTFTDMIDGGTGNDSLNIFTDPAPTNTSTVIGPDPNRNVVIREGRISINPTWNFLNFQNVGIVTGGGNDTVTTQFTSFLQYLNGGGGTDTLNFSQAPHRAPSPVTRSGAGPVFYTGFEILNFAPPAPDAPTSDPTEDPVNPTADTGGILQLQLDLLDQGTGGPENEGDITMQPFVDGTGTGGIGALQNALGAFSAMTQQGVIFAGLDSGAIFIVPFSLDGSGIQPSNFGIQLLRESLAPDANIELLAALGLDRGIFLIEGDGPFALDLSGFPTLAATIQSLLEQLSPTAHAELQSALGFVIVVLLTPADGPVALDASGAQPAQVSLIILNEHLGQAALDELNAALGIQ